MCVCVCVLLIIIYIYIEGSPEGSEAGSRMGCTQRSSLSLCMCVCVCVCYVCITCVCVCVLLVLLIIYIYIGGSPEGSEAGSRMGCTQRSSLSHFKHLQRAAPPLSTTVANTPRGGGGVSRSEGGGLDFRLTAQKLQSETNGVGSSQDQALLASHYQCAMQVVCVCV
jgi:hypothetical protein